jgi:hypothetical protein
LISGDACSCGAPHVEATRPKSEEPALSLREKIVVPRITQASDVSRKITTIALMRLIIGRHLWKNFRRRFKVRV